MPGASRLNLGEGGRRRRGRKDRALARGAPYRARRSRPHDLRV